MEPFNYRAMLPDPSHELLKSLQIGAQLAGQRKTPEEVAADQQRLELLKLQTASARQEAAAAPAMQSARLASEQALAEYRRAQAAEQQQELDRYNVYSENVAKFQETGDISFMERASLYAPTKMMEESRKNLDLIRKNVGDPITKQYIASVSRSLPSAWAGNAERSAEILTEEAQSFSNSENPKVKALSPMLLRLADQMLSDPKNAATAAFMGLSAVDQKAAENTVKIFSDILGGQVKQAEVKEKEALTSLNEIKASIEKSKLGGEFVPEEMVKAERDLSKEYNAVPVIREFPEITSRFNSIMSASENPIGDKSMVVDFIKLKDPNSTVSVTESGQIEATTGVQKLQNLAAMMNSLIKTKGENAAFLDPKVRKNIKAESKVIFDNKKKEVDRITSNYRKVAEQYKLSPDRVTLVIGEVNDPVTDKMDLNRADVVAPSKDIPPAGAVRRIR
jgi:hypothetical protein